MSGRWLAVVLALSLAAVLGCGGGSEMVKDGADQNAAVADTHWGAERVVYAADLDGYWDSEKTKPSAEQWSVPPEGRGYLKFTYCGAKLTRLETFGEDGKPYRWLKAGVKVEWKYASHGGLLEETGYTEDGGVDEHNTRRYDESGRLAEEAYGYGTGDIVTRVVYSYSGARAHPSSQETVGPGGALISRSTFTYGADANARTEKYEVYGGTDEVMHSDAFKQRWNPEAGEWQKVEE